MLPCGICIESLDTPVALPCGHIFCNQCIQRAVDAVKQYSTLHGCPTCRSMYTVANVDPSLVPVNLRPHIGPSIRRIYLDEPTQSPRTVTSTTEVAIENGRLNAENSALRLNCQMWRRRAEVHGAANLGLLKFVRKARDEVAKLQSECDEVHEHCSRPNKEPTINRLTAPPRISSPLSEIELYSDTPPFLLSSLQIRARSSPSASNVDGSASSRPAKRPRLAKPLELNQS